MRNSTLTRLVLASFLAVLPLTGCQKPTPASKKSRDNICPKIKGDPRLKDFQEVRVIKIADGDTFTACLMPNKEGSVRVRILGIDCPESRVNAKCKSEETKGRSSCADQIPLGLKATRVARSLLFEQIVSLESRNGDGNFEKDRYGRWLAYVRMKNGKDFGKSMIQNGHCENYQWKYPHPRGEEYGPSKP